MWCNMRDVIFQSSDIVFHESHKDLAERGRWSFLTFESECIMPSYAIWHISQPIQRFLNHSTHHVIDTIEAKLWQWLDPYSMEPIQVPEPLRLPSDYLIAHIQGMPVADSKHEALRILFDYADFIGQAHGEFSQVETTCHIAWVGEAKEIAYPEPELTSFTLNDPSTTAQLETILSVMRYPCLYDGGVEFLFERTLKAAVRLLLGPWSISVSSDVKHESTKGSSHFPLVVECEGEELTDDVCTKMAKAVHPTLKRLVEIHAEDDALPPHCFVYGLYFSRRYVSFLVHFPILVETAPGTTRWEFRQIVLSHFSITFGEGYPNDQDGLFLRRWRLLIALFAVFRHIKVLEKDIGVVSTRQHCNMLDSESFNEHFRFRSLCDDLPIHLRNLCSTWRQERLYIPSRWIVSDETSINTRLVPPETLQDMAIHLPHQLAAILSVYLRKSVLPLDDDVLLQNHTSKSFVGPDFLHRMHSPRSNFSCSSKEADKVDKGVNTWPHFFKAQEFLAMAAYDWTDVNRFIANLLGGFSTYSVRWDPVIRYPFPVSRCSSDLCAVDFALAVQAIPATTSYTIERARSLPLTLSSPAMLVGFHSTGSGEGHIVSKQEIAALSASMEPHLKLFHHYNVGTIAEDPTLYCTYVKPNFLHILAFNYASHSGVSCTLVDSLPLTLIYSTEAHLLDRLRVVIALFTLQREVVKLSEYWAFMRHPWELLLNEQDAIVEVTGCSTPTPTVDVPLKNEVQWGWDDEFESGSEDDKRLLKKEIAKSVRRVTKWLARMVPLKLQLSPENPRRSSPLQRNNM